MTKEKLQSLVKYSQELLAKRNSPVPAKWSHSPDTYRAFVEREIRITNAKIDAAKMAGGSAEKAAK